MGWVRRTRVDGDGWDAFEVPLGEDAELYLGRVMQGSTVVREAQVTQPGWTYSAADQATDGLSAPFDVTVAQVSSRFGPGPAARVEVA